jgi:hypothetical protein
LAYTVSRNDRWFVVVDGKEGEVFDSVGRPKFSPDSRHSIYNAAVGERAHLVVDGRKSASFPGSWDELFSGDSKKIISIQNSAEGNNVHTVVITDLTFGSRREQALDAILFIYNNERNRIAAIGLDKEKHRLIELSIEKPEQVKRGQVYNNIDLHTFGPDGVSVAYVADKEGKRILVLNGREELLPEGAPVNWPAVRPDGKAAGIILAGKDGQFFHQAFENSGRKTKAYEEAGQPLYSPDGSRFAFVAKRGKDVFMVVSGKEGPAYDMVVSPQFSTDGRFLIYRARKDGQRFVVVADADGKTLREHPRYELVFPVVVTGDGASVAYGVKNGEKLEQIVEKLP